MIDVTTSWGRTIFWVAVCGALGGIVYELALDRLGDSGMVEKWSSVRDDKGVRTYWDFGFLASIVIGAAAAVAFLYFLPPETRTVTATTPGGADVVTRFYEWWKLYPVALIVGMGGVSFVKAMRERVLRALIDAKAGVAGQGAVTVEELLAEAQQSSAARAGLAADDDTLLKIAEARGALKVVRTTLNGSARP